jgi:hypothetical protein
MTRDPLPAAVLEHERGEAGQAGQKLVGNLVGAAAGETAAVWQHSREPEPEVRVRDLPVAAAAAATAWLDRFHLDDVAECRQSVQQLRDSLRGLPDAAADIVRAIPVKVMSLKVMSLKITSFELLRYALRDGAGRTDADTGRCDLSDVADVARSRMVFRTTLSVAWSRRRFRFGGPPPTPNG